MKVFLIALVFFLIAFAGLAAGLLLKRKGLRGGCTPAPGSDRDCQCKSATAPTLKTGINHLTRDGAQPGDEEDQPV
jgi:hypothetical protein